MPVLDHRFRPSTMSTIEHSSCKTACRRLTTASNAHPFTILPVEIVNEIFMHCLPVRIEDSKPIPTEAPLLLCHVSSYWRKAAIADPRLWKRLTLNPQSLHKISSLGPLSQTTKQMVDQSFFWLANAKDLGLAIDLTIPPPCYVPEITDSGDMLEPSFSQISEKWNGFIFPVLVEQASRFKTLRLSFGVAALLQPFFFAEDRVTLSRLESLTIKGDRLQVTDDSSEPGKILTLKRFASADRLTKAAILVKHRIPFPLQLPLNFLPWTQLTHLMITMPCSGSFWKRVLPSCGRLEVGYINIEYGNLAPDDGDPPLPEAGYVELPRLRTLDVTFHDEFTSAWFETFRFPVLRKLLVACDFGSGFPTFTWLPSAQNNQFLNELRSLTSLTLSYQNMVEVELVGILKHTVLLEDLVVDSYLTDHKSFFQALVVKPDSTPDSRAQEGKQEGEEEVSDKPMLPRLRVFKFYLEYFAEVPATTFDEEDFLAVMASRSEVAREMANNLVDEPASQDTHPITQCESESESSESETWTDEDDDEEDSDDTKIPSDELPFSEENAAAPPAHTTSITVATTTTTTTTTDPPTPTIVALRPLKPATPRPKFPPISKLIVPIRQVQLSTDASDKGLFKRLGQLEAGITKHTEEVSTPQSPEFAFRLEFSSPSDWALQDSEPNWF